MMTPPTNGATSLGFPPMAAGLPDEMFFHFDVYPVDDEFFITAPPPPPLPGADTAPPPPPPPGADPNRLLLLPSSCNHVDVHGSGCSSAPEALAVAAPTSTVATSGSSSASPSPSLPLMPNAAGQRTSCYRGVTRHRWTGQYEAHLKVTIRHSFLGLRGRSKNLFSFSRPSTATDWAKTCPMVI